MAFVPGTRRQQNWPSTVAYLAQLIIHRYAMLGVLDERGYPTREMGILESPRDDNEPKLMQGALCNECGNHTVIRKDGCDALRQNRLPRSPWKSGDRRPRPPGERAWRCMSCVHRFHAPEPRRLLRDNPIVAAVGGSTLLLTIAVIAILWFWKS